MKLVKKIVTTALVFGMAATSLFAAKEGWPKEVNFGVIPVSGSTSMKENFTPLTNYLQETLGVKVNLILAGDYTGIIAGMQHKHVDVAYLGPKAYIEAVKRAKAEIIAIEADGEYGTLGYKSIIITKKGSGLKTLEDTKGKIWAFTSSQSASGALVPAVMLAKRGIEPKKYFKKVMYSGGHEASMLSVKAGRIDVASTNNLDYNRGLGKQWTKDDFNIIWESELIPAAPIAVRKDLPQNLKEAIKKAFIDYKDPIGMEKMKNKGFAEGNDSMYDPIRELIKFQENNKSK